MNILAIETSCDETAAAVVKDGRTVLSSLVSSQIDTHRKYGGTVPEIASRLHTETISALTKQTLCEACLDMKDIDAVAVTSRPGLIGALLVGVSFAKGLAYSSGKPLIPVHHTKGHVAANYIAFPDLQPPFLALIVSGGHTTIALVKSYTEYETIGRTKDDAAGEAYDKAARVLGYGYPGGPLLDKAYYRGDPHKYRLPEPSVEGSPYDFSFSGLKTAVINTVHNLTQKGIDFNPDDLAASFQQTAVKMLTDRFFAAGDKYSENGRPPKLVLAGGVTANSLLRQRCTELAAQRGAELYLPPTGLCTDNAAMIGAQGYFDWLAGERGSLDENAFATAPF